MPGLTKEWKENLFLLKPTTCFKHMQRDPTQAMERRTGHTHTFIEQSSKDLRLVVQAACWALVPDKEETKWCSEISTLITSHNEFIIFFIDRSIAKYRKASFMQIPLFLDKSEFTQAQTEVHIHTSTIQLCIVDTQYPHGYWGVSMGDWFQNFPRIPKSADAWVPYVKCPSICL